MPHKLLQKVRNFSDLCLLFLLLCEALAAIHRAILARAERNLCFAAARCTGSNEHFTLGPGCILTGVAASFAALGLVYKALRFIKLLLAGSENEFLATLFADESLVFVHVFYLA